MSTNLKLFLICFAALTLTTSMVSAAPRGGGMGGAQFSSMPARSAPAFAHSGSGTFRKDHFDHFHHRTFIFIDAFGFPFFSPFPYYGYYPYGTILMVTMDTTITRSPLTDTATAIEPASQRRSADLLALVTIMVPSMGSWDRKHDERFARTSAPIICPHMA